MDRRSRRVKTPIFDALAARYNGYGDGKDHATWLLGAYMRGFTYGLVLQDMVREPAPPRPKKPLFGEPWHFTPSPWDAIDATPNEHHPDL